jgi:hypothetical protein
MPPTLLLSPQLKTDAPSAHFIFLLCGRAKSAARPVIHRNPDQEHMTTVLYARHPASVLVSYAGMVLKRALVEPTDRGFMLNEGKTDVLPNEAVGASEGRHTTERKIADPVPVRRDCRVLRGPGRMRTQVPSRHLSAPEGVPLIDFTGARLSRVWALRAFPRRRRSKVAFSSGKSRRSSVRCGESCLTDYVAASQFPQRTGHCPTAAEEIQSAPKLPKQVS